MKVKMLTTRCGPDISNNWSEGQVRNIDANEARMLEKSGLCVLLEPYPSEAEKAVLQVSEKAKVSAPENAGNITVLIQDEKANVSAPAAPADDKTQAAAPGWGKGDKK